MGNNIHHSATVHPTAIVSSSVMVHEDVEIGPFCVLDGNVVLKSGVKVHSHVCITGQTEIGSNTEIFPFAAIGFKPQDLKFNGEESRIVIGAHNSIREYVTIHPGTSGGSMETRVGNKCLLMVGSHVAHDCIIGNNVVIANHAAIAGHVTLEDYVIIGGLAAVHQFVRVGKHSMVGGVTGVREDVPPYSIVVGQSGKLRNINSVGMKRHNFSKKEIAEVTEAFKKIFYDHEGLMSSRVASIRKVYSDNRAISDVLDFLESSTKRSICLPQRKEKGVEDDI